MDKLPEALYNKAKIRIHRKAESMAVKNRILLLKGGRVVECAAPAAFVASAKPEVREFLAAMKGESI